MKSNNENEGDVYTIPLESDESGTINFFYISMMYLDTLLRYTEEFGDTKGVIRIRKSKGRKWPNNTHKTYT
jgi:hypothetical protein